MTDEGDARGVMGYVAEIQQFDDSITAAPPGDAPPEEPQERERPDAGAPPGVPAKPGRPPWTRAEVGLAVAFVVLANRPSPGELALPLPPAAEAEPSPSVGGGPAPGTAGVTPEARAESSSPAGAEPSGRPEATAAANPTATYAREANTGLLGLTGYRGKVTVTNRGAGAASTWEVTLSLPAGQEVSTVEGAAFRQEGTLVTFTPSSGSLQGGQSVTFTFDVPGLLAGEPTGCAINGRPCEG
jgi:hypothetical protein